MKKGLVTVRPVRLSCRSTCRVNVLKGLCHEIVLYCTNRQAVLVSQYQFLEIVYKILNCKIKINLNNNNKMHDTLRNENNTKQKPTAWFLPYLTVVSLCCPQGADPPPPTSYTRGKAGRNHLNEEITPLLPTGIGERFSQNISNLGHAALLRRCEL
jgi:hypothetical protein